MRESGRHDMTRNWRSSAPIKTEERLENLWFAVALLCRQRAVALGAPPVGEGAHGAHRCERLRGGSIEQWNGQRSDRCRSGALQCMCMTLCSVVCWLLCLCLFIRHFVVLFFICFVIRCLFCLLYSSFFRSLFCLWDTLFMNCQMHTKATLFDRYRAGLVRAVHCVFVCGVRNDAVWPVTTVCSLENKIITWYTHDKVFNVILFGQCRPGTCWRTFYYCPLLLYAFDTCLSRK